MIPQDINGKRKNLQSGQAVLTAVVFFLFISLALIFGYVAPVAKEVKMAGDLVASKKIYIFSESGLEDAIYRIRNNKQYQANYNLASGDYSADINISSVGNFKIIQSDAAHNNSVRKAEATLMTEATQVSFHYGVQVGAGGVDMGQNSKVIGNIYSNGSIIGSSGAKIEGDAIVVGHLEENMTARSVSCTQDQIAGKTNPQIDFAQSFIATASEPLGKISLYIKKSGSPAGRTVKIVADSGGSPADSALASGTLSESLVTTSYGWVDIVFSSPPLLSTGGTYWIVLDASQDSNDYWIWCKDGGAGYGDGSGKYSEDWDDDPWVSITGDLNFRTYFGAGQSLLDDVIVLEDAKANTITESKICGDAYYQSIDSSSLNFLNNPTSQTCGTPTTDGTAYPDSEDPPVENMPISEANINQWKADAAAGGQIDGNYSVSSSVSLGPKEITGDLLMTSNNKVLTVTGTIYVHGNIEIQNGSAIRCAASYGTRSCIVLADGWIHVENNSTFAGSGTAGSWLMLLTTVACDGSFSTGCTHHNGAVDLHNNATGVIFYVPNGLVHLHNGVNLTEVTAYKLQLENTAVITYNQGLENADFSSGPSGGWIIDDWKETQ